MFCCTVDHVELAIVPAGRDPLLIGLYVLADEFFIGWTSFPSRLLWVVSAA